MGRRRGPRRAPLTQCCPHTQALQASGVNAEWREGHAHTHTCTFLQCYVIAHTERRKHHFTQKLKHIHSHHAHSHHAHRCPPQWTSPPTFPNHTGTYMMSRSHALARSTIMHARAHTRTQTHTHKHALARKAEAAGGGHCSEDCDCGAHAIRA